MFDPAVVRARLEQVRAQIARAASRAGRDSSRVRLIAVSKTFSTDHIRAAADAGQIDFGENKVQEALDKITTTAGRSLRWHFIGHLQSNKSKKAAENFDVIHSVDSIDLLRRVDEAARAADRRLDVFVQVDLVGEATKHGIPPEHLRPLFVAARQFAAAQVKGLMIIPPARPDAESARPYFAALRTLRDDLLSSGVEPAMLQELSMGMSHDFEVAVEEGATMIRVGSAIFGERTYV